MILDVKFILDHSIYSWLLCNCFLIRGLVTVRFVVLTKRAAHELILQKIDFSFKVNLSFATSSLIWGFWLENVLTQAEHLS